MMRLQELLAVSASRHSHLCPRQVLGVRMGLAGGEALGMQLPHRDKGLLIIIETDGCFADGIEAATGCTLGHRTLRVEDYGKVAATFIQVNSGHAVRLAPRQDVRQRAFLYAPAQLSNNFNLNYIAQLYGYQSMPSAELFSFQEIVLAVSVRDLVSRPGLRVNCDACGEEIINQRQVQVGERLLCRACAGPAYYQAALAVVGQVPEYL
jgi:formylmethanofuran dehydrogenase subunit E